MHDSCWHVGSIWELEKEVHRKISGIWLGIEPRDHVIATTESLDLEHTSMSPTRCPSAFIWEGLIETLHEANAIMLWLWPISFFLPLQQEQKQVKQQRIFSWSQPSFCAQHETCSWLGLLHFHLHKTSIYSGVATCTMYSLIKLGLPKHHCHGGYIYCAIIEIKLGLPEHHHITVATYNM